MLKLVSLFLIGIVVLAFLGRFRLGNLLAGRKSRTGPLPRPARCLSCGQFVIGTGPCACGTPKA